MEQRVYRRFRSSARRILCGCAVVVLFVGESGRIRAADFAWVNPNGGSFLDASNWSPVGIPAAGDNAIFDLHTSGYATDSFFLADQVNIFINNDTLTGVFDGRRLSIADAAGSQGALRLNGSSQYVNVDAGSVSGGLSVGTNGNGTIDALNAQVHMTGSFVVADGAGSSGTVTLDQSKLGTPGFGSALDMTSATIAKSGHATLDARNNSRFDLGGPLVVAEGVGSSAMISLDDSRFGTPGFGSAGMTSATIAQSGSVTLDVANNSEVNLGGPLVIAADTGSDAAISVDHSRFGTPGFGSTRVTSATIAQSGRVTFDVTGNSQVNLGGPLVIAADTGSDAAVSVDNSSFFMRESRSIGMISATIAKSGRATFDVTNESQVHLTGSLVVGEDVGSHGTVRVDNSTFGTLGLGGSELSLVTVGGAGYGALSITGGSRANLDGDFTVGRDSGAQGVVVIDGPGTVAGTPGFGSNGFQSATIGAAGEGSLAIVNGGTYYLTGAWAIGNEAGSTGSVRIDGAGSRLVEPGFGSPQVSGFVIGKAGAGSVSISQGGQAVIPAPVVMAAEPSSHATLTVAGAGSLFSANDLYVGGTYTGPGGAASVEITAGGQLSVGIAVAKVWPTGSVDLESSTFVGNVENRGVFRNNGTIVGDFTNESGGVLSGDGLVTGLVAIDSGSTLARGNSPGTMTMGHLGLTGGATLDLAINSAHGSAGGALGWSNLVVNGFWGMNGDPRRPVHVNLLSLLPDNSPGNVFDFDPTRSYLWTFAEGASDFIGFSPDFFVVDTAEFTNPIGPNHFEVRLIGRRLVVAYVPEPSTFGLAVLGAAALLAARSRFRTRRQKRE